MIVRQSPVDSALSRALHGDRAMWGLTEHLLASISDGIAILAWQNTVDGQKGRNRPRAIQRPGIEPEDEQRFGSSPLSIEEMDAWLGWNKGDPAVIDEAMTELDGGDIDG